jgi:metal-responsive CopG/Arc/MetJ family transcriptional regulator
MMKEMRTIVELPQEQIDALDGICRTEGISRAEAVRRAVALLVTERAAAAGRHAFGLWKGRGTDGVAYQRRVRGEWRDRAGRP